MAGISITLAKTSQAHTFIQPRSFPTCFTKACWQASIFSTSIIRTGSHVIHNRESDPESSPKCRIIVVCYGIRCLSCDSQRSYWVHLQHLAMQILYKLWRYDFIRILHFHIHRSCSTLTQMPLNEVAHWARGSLQKDIHSKEPSEVLLFWRTQTSLEEEYIGKKQSHRKYFFKI